MTNNTKKRIWNIVTILLTWGWVIYALATKQWVMLIALVTSAIGANMGRIMLENQHKI